MKIFCFLSILYILISNFSINHCLPSQRYFSNNENSNELNSLKAYTPTFTPTETTIKVTINTDITTPLECTGQVIKKEGGAKVFTCADDAGCKACKEFTVTGLEMNTMYTFQITSKTAGVAISGDQKTLPKQAFSAVKTATDTTIVTTITTTIPGVLACTGKITKKSDGSTALDCASNAQCKLCQTFTVSGLTQNTEYSFDISGDNELIKINGDITTLLTETYTATKAATSSKVFVTVNTNIAGPLACTGTLAPKTGGGAAVFTCQNDANCKLCKSFVISENLAASTVYTFDITNADNSKVSITGDVTTTAASTFEVGFTPAENQIGVDIKTTLASPLTCKGTVKEVESKNTVFTCESDEACKKCQSFTVKNLKNATAYIFAIIGDNAAAKVEGTVTTTQSHYFELSAKAGQASIDVEASSNLAGLSCTGSVTEVSSKKTVFDCASNFDCTVCRSFSVTGLSSESKYDIVLNGNFPNSKFEQQVKTPMAHSKVVGIAVGVTVGVLAVVGIAVGLFFGLKK